MNPPLPFINRDLRDIARDFLANADAFPSFAADTLQAAREASKAFDRPPLDFPRIERRLITGPPGAPLVALYLINTDATSRRPAILHTHGGGFVAGTALSAIAELQHMAAELDCAIITVDYRIAPENTFRDSVEDNYAALIWLSREAATVGVDPKRIAVMGESAGGGHAALLALLARDRGEVAILFQCLIYPMLDDRTGSVRIPAPPIGTILWTCTDNQFGWHSFLGQPPGGDDVPAGSVPSRRNDLTGLPPTFIAVGSLDLFVDEDLEYARRLIEGGVPTEVIVVPGAFHGFDMLAPESPVAKSFTAAKLAALRRAFADDQEHVAV